MYIGTMKNTQQTSSSKEVKKTEQRFVTRLVFSQFDHRTFDYYATGISNDDGFRNNYIIYKLNGKFVLQVNNTNKIKGTLAVCKAAAQDIENKIK